MNNNKWDKMCPTKNQKLHLKYCSTDGISRNINISLIHLILIEKQKSPVFRLIH